MRSAEMPRYKCHKEVWALKIAEVRWQEGEVVDDSGELVPVNERYAPIPVSAAYILKHNPQPGGYYVVYADGYKSYSPAEAFEDGYSPVDQNVMLTFEQALSALKDGKKIARAGWNGKGMFLFYNPGSEVKITEGRPLASAFPVGTECRMLPYIMMKTAAPDLEFVPWLASQTDILACDWVIL